MHIYIYICVLHNIYTVHLIIPSLFPLELVIDIAMKVSIQRKAVALKINKTNTHQYG